MTRRRLVIASGAVAAAAVVAAGAGLYLRWRGSAGRTDTRAAWVDTAPFAPPAVGSRSSRLGDLQHGAEVFAASCASCHGNSGRGDGPAGDLVRARPRDLADPAAMNARSDADLHRVVSAGGLATGRSWLMPKFGAELDALDIWDVVAFIRSLHPSVADIVPAAADWTPYDIVLWGAAPPALRGSRVTYFEARDRAGAALAFVTFAELPADRGSAPAWLAVAEDPAGRPLGARRFGGSAASPEAEEAARARLRAARAEWVAERERAEGRLAALRAAPERVPEGERLFIERCAPCHGATGQRLAGVTRAGAGLLPPRNLADAGFLATRTDADIAEAIRHGGLAVGISSDMPASPDLSPGQLDALVVFVRSLAVSSDPREGGR